MELFTHFCWFCHLFGFGWWYTLMKDKHKISLYLGLKKWLANILQITFSNRFSFKKIVFIKILQQIFSCNQAALWMVQSACLSVCLSDCLSVCLSIYPFARLPVCHTFSLCSDHDIIMKFSGVITNDRSDVYAKVQGQRTKVKVTEVKTQISRFRTITPVWFHIWCWNDT